MVEGGGSEDEGRKHLGEGYPGGRKEGGHCFGCNCLVVVVVVGEWEKWIRMVDKDGAVGELRAGTRSVVPLRTTMRWGVEQAEELARGCPRNALLNGEGIGRARRV